MTANYPSKSIVFQILEHVNVSNRSLSSSHSSVTTGGSKRPQLPEPQARAPLKSPSGPESKLDPKRELAPRRRAEDRYGAGVDRILASKPQDNHHADDEGGDDGDGDGRPVSLSPDALTAFSNEDPDAKQRNQ